MQIPDFNLIKDLTHKTNFINHCTLAPSDQALAIYELSKQHASLVCVIANSSSHANQLQDELLFFGITNIHQLPAWETLAYDLISPHKDIISNRLSCLHNLPHTNSGILILTTDYLEFSGVVKTFACSVLDVNTNFEEHYIIQE